MAKKEIVEVRFHNGGKLVAKRGDGDVLEFWVFDDEDNGFMVSTEEARTLATMAATRRTR